MLKKRRPLINTGYQGYFLSHELCFRPTDDQMRKLVCNGLVCCPWGRMQCGDLDPSAGQKGQVRAWDFMRLSHLARLWFCVPMRAPWTRTIIAKDGRCAKQPATEPAFSDFFDLLKPSSPCE